MIKKNPNCFDYDDRGEQQDKSISNMNDFFGRKKTMLFSSMFFPLFSFRFVVLLSTQFNSTISIWKHGRRPIIKSRCFFFFGSIKKKTCHTSVKHNTLTGEKLWQITGCPKYQWLSVDQYQNTSSIPSSTYYYGQRSNRKRSPRYQKKKQPIISSPRSITNIFIHNIFFHSKNIFRFVSVNDERLINLLQGKR